MHLGKDKKENLSEKVKDAGMEEKEEIVDESAKHIESSKRVEELTLDLKRLQAEFENYQKRSQKQNEDFKLFANASLLDDLLPVLDSLEIGIKHNKEFVAVYEQLFSILKKKGLVRIEVNVGDKFDHDIMDCLMQENNPKLKEGTVVQVLSTGYKLNGRILRTTKISINKLNNENENKKEENEKCAEKVEEKNKGVDENEQKK